MGVGGCFWSFTFSHGATTTGINPALIERDHPGKISILVTRDTVAASGWTDYFGDPDCFLDTLAEPSGGNER